MRAVFLPLEQLKGATEVIDGAEPCQLLGTELGLGCSHPLESWRLHLWVLPSLPPSQQLEKVVRTSQGRGLWALWQKKQEARPVLPHTAFLEIQMTIFPPCFFSETTG